MPFIYNQDIEEIEPYEPGDDESGHGPEYESFVANRIKLSQKLDAMDPDDKKIFMKIMRFKVLKEVMDAVKNMKSTTASTWKSVMGKLEAITGINIGDDNSGFDFNKMAKTLLPLIGSLAGTMIAFRSSQKAESEAAKPQTDPDNPEQDVITPEIAEKETEKIFNESLAKSVVLEMCEKNQNGFSLNG